MKTYLHIVVLLSLMVVGCARTVDDRVEEVVATPSLLKLSAIDSLMWWRADSALAVMMEFAASPMADSLGVFEGHYCQVLIAELLYKNDYGQSNRAEVLKAVHFFDSIVGMDGADARGKADARGASVQGRDAFWRHGRIILMVWGIMSATALLRLARNTSTLCG